MNEFKFGKTTRNGEDEAMKVTPLEAKQAQTICDIGDEVGVFVSRKYEGQPTEVVALGLLAVCFKGCSMSGISKEVLKHHIFHLLARPWEDWRS